MTEKTAIAPTGLLRQMPMTDFLAPGHRACPGCAEVLALKLVLRVLGPNIIVVMATGCMEIISTPFPYTSWRIPWMHTLFENTAAVASGVESGLRVLERRGRGTGGQRAAARLPGSWSEANTPLLPFRSASPFLDRRVKLLRVPQRRDA